MVTLLRMNFVILNCFKGSNSCFTDDILEKLYVHSCVIIIHVYIQFEFHEVLIVMANFMGFKPVQGNITCALMKSV